MNKKIVIYVKDPINAQHEVDCALNDRLHKLCDELNQLIGKQDIQRITEICDIIKNLITYKVKLEVEDEKD